MATPPFLPDETKPGASDLISLYPSVEQTFRDVIESWLLIEHNTNGTHKQVTVDDIATPTIAANLVGLWHESGVLKTRFAAGTVYDLLTSNTGLATAGGTMTGDLVLNGDPDADLKAATKAYVDAHPGAGAAPLNSPTFTGDPKGPTPSANDNDTSLATTAFVTTAVASIPFSKSYESAVQTITSAGLLTLTHSLGSAPTLVQALIKNTSAELGYSSGDITPVSVSYNSNISADLGISIVLGATTVKVRYGGNATVFTILNKSTGVRGNITNSKWKLIIRAWL